MAPVLYPTGMRLIVERCQEHFQAFVYDPDRCEVLHTAERMDVEAAKSAAVDFVAATRFGPQHGLKLQVIADMLVWDPT